MRLTLLLLSFLAVTGCASPIVGRLEPRAPSAQQEPEPALVSQRPAPLSSFVALFRELPSASALEAAEAFAVRAPQVAGECPYVHVERKEREVTADFGVCPAVRGSMTASFADTADGSVTVSMVMHDFWQRGSDVLDGSWHVALTAGEPQFAGAVPWRDWPSKSHAVAQRGSSASGSGLGKGKLPALLVPFYVVAALSQASTR